ncbi:hypothetical protein Y032_0014g2293 [Ancylostoma ceylanicum]|nr:hypothetical protein Y032_0014g2293 [Ancylostoma ceylanicum]
MRCYVITNISAPAAVRNLELPGQRWNFRRTSVDEALGRVRKCSYVAVVKLTGSGSRLIFHRRLQRPPTRRSSLTTGYGPFLVTSLIVPFVLIPTLWTGAPEEGMPISDDTYKIIFDEIDARQDEFVKVLKEAVAIASVSSDPERRSDCVKMVMWTKKKLESVGATVQIIENGKQKLQNGKTIDLPPILFGVLGNDPKKKTVLVYGHLDVQPAAKEDGWNTNPFELTEVDGKLFGRGSTDDKGPVVAWVHAISVLQKKKVPIPVNLKFVFECMEESGSEGLEQALRNHKDTFLKDVDMTCISDNYWLGKNKPCLTYGLRSSSCACSLNLLVKLFQKLISLEVILLLRGICYYFVEIGCAKQDLHSGTYGGSIPEAMNDLIWVLSQLTEKDGTIKIPHIYDIVAPVTDDEKKMYEGIDFCMDEYKKDIEAHGLLKPTKEEILMNRWRYPSLSIHGIEGAFSNSGAKTVIPSKVHHFSPVLPGKFSLRIVPNMTPEAVDKLVIDHLNNLWKQRGSPNHFKPIAYHSGSAWLADYKDDNFRAGARAMKRVFGVEPDYTREGGSIPITLAFQDLTGRSVMLLPIGACDDMAHSQNEKLDRSNYIKVGIFPEFFLVEANNYILQHFSIPGNKDSGCVSPRTCGITRRRTWCLLQSWDTSINSLQWCTFDKFVVFAFSSVFLCRSKACS